MLCKFALYLGVFYKVYSSNNPLNSFVSKATELYSLESVGRIEQMFIGLRSALNFLLSH